MKTTRLLILFFGFTLIILSGFTFKHRLYNSLTPVKKPRNVGDTFNLSRYKGKVVVLNFWASWSKASRGESKNLVRVYDGFKNNAKVVFVSVSLDTDEAAWKLAIEEDELKWKDHFCDFKKYESPVVIKYQVTTLPKFLVLDQDTKLISSQVNSHGLEVAINALIK